MARESHFERVFQGLLREEVRRLNNHLPRRRKSLRLLLAESEPAFENVAGEQMRLKMEEIEKFAKALPQELWDSIRLPIVLLRRMDLGRSVYVVCGEKIEERAIGTILGLRDHSRPAQDDREELYIYKPHVSELLAKFHTLIVIGFGIPKELGL